jgi:predicted RNA-binding Zn-ribbon protein involved in translation (DUF1610 family)
MRHVTPARDAASFTCPFCGVYAAQQWLPFVVGYEHKGSVGGMAWSGIGHEAEGLVMSVCGSCGEPMIWHGDEPIWPVASSAPSPSNHMPDDVRADFEEARGVVDRSPRSAAALLRISMLALCRALGQPGENLDREIEALVRAGLPFTVRLALEAARVVGDKTITPGTLDDRDDRKTALALFGLVNAMVDKMIAEPATWRTS